MGIIGMVPAIGVSHSPPLDLIPRIDKLVRLVRSAATPSGGAGPTPPSHRGGRDVTIPRWRRGPPQRAGEPPSTWGESAQAVGPSSRPNPSANPVGGLRKRGHIPLSAARTRLRALV